MSFVALDRYLKRITTTSVPGIACWVGRTTRTHFFETYGYAQCIPRRVKIKQRTLFDLASLTKPFATALAILHLVHTRRLRISTPVSRVLPQFKITRNSTITIKQLLTHTAGLPAWFPMYVLPEKIRTWFLMNVTNGKTAVEYSCLGYILLGTIIESITGKGLDRYCKNKLYAPHGLSDFCFTPKSRRNVAATEHGDVFERGMAGVYCDPTVHTWRRYVIRGEVHDGNCYYAYNGVSGNAGLFGTAEGCARFLQMYQRGELLPKRIIAEMIKDHTGGREKRGYGWWINPYPGVLSRYTYAHTGFTGTLACVDPQYDVIIVLLTNAIHPRVQQEMKKKMRRRVVQIVAETLRCNKTGCAL